MDETIVDVEPYSIGELICQLANNAHVSDAEISKHIHATYFREYFEIIGATMIVAEHDYVDHDYLEDYAEYYVRCFKEYPRKCRRLHFFKDISFTKSELLNLVAGGDSSISENDLEENYLGFIVAKPLPKTVVGRTCLKVYQPENRRHYPVTRSYPVNLFGIQLHVDNTLAYQEQDQVVAACATSALWSVFQGTGMIFHHAIPSPSQITKKATELITTEDKAFPSSGLDAVQMALAIQSVGLEQNPVSVRDKQDIFDEFTLKATAYAYLSSGIPMIMGQDMYDTCGPSPFRMGKHAVAVTGYSLDKNTPFTPYKDDKFLLKASKIDKLYVHDDQIGPFSRMVFDGNHVIIPNTGSISGSDLLPSMSTSWTGVDGDPSTIGCGRAIPDILLIP